MKDNVKNILMESKLQLEYLNEKQPRATTTSTISKLDTVLQEILMDGDDSLDSSINWIDDNIYPPVDGNKIYLVDLGNKRFDVGRFNEWGWHYGSRNTQDALFGVVRYFDFET